MDFGITGSGNLDLVQQGFSTGFRLRFRHGDRQGLQVRFVVTEQNSAAPTGDLRVTFHIADPHVIGGYSVRVLENDDELIQLIKIALETELGELPNRPLIGSDIVSCRHQSLWDATRLATLQSVSETALATLLPNVQVIAKPELGGGFLYCCHASLYIYRSGKLLTQITVY